MALSFDGLDSDPYSLDTAGLGSVDLTSKEIYGYDFSYDRFAVQLLFIDVSTTLSFTVYSGAGNESSSAELVLPELTFSGRRPVLHLRFANFVGTADFTDVSAIEVVIDGVPGLDLQIGYIAAVPEPGSGAASLAVMTSLALLGRRARRAKQDPLFECRNDQLTHNVRHDSLVWEAEVLGRGNNNQIQFIYDQDVLPTKAIGQVSVVGLLTDSKTRSPPIVAILFPQGR